MPCWSEKPSQFQEAECRDSNEGEVYYKHEDNTWTVNPPDWILEIGENDWGESIFEQTLWENISGMIVDDEIYTHEDDELWKLH